VAAGSASSCPPTVRSRGSRGEGRTVPGISRGAPGQQNSEFFQAATSKKTRPPRGGQVPPFVNEGDKVRHFNTDTGEYQFRRVCTLFSDSIGGRPGFAGKAVRPKTVRRWTATIRARFSGSSLRREFLACRGAPVVASGSGPHASFNMRGPPRRVHHGRRKPRADRGWARPRPQRPSCGGCGSRCRYAVPRLIADTMVLVGRRGVAATLVLARLVGVAPALSLFGPTALGMKHVVFALSPRGDFGPCGVRVARVRQSMPTNWSGLLGAIVRSAAMPADRLSTPC